MTGSSSASNIAGFHWDSCPRDIAFRPIPQGVDRPPGLACAGEKLRRAVGMVALYLASVESSVFHSRTGIFRARFQQADHSKCHIRHTGWHWHKLPQSICVFSEFGECR
jgi:hypothetical protein